MGLGDITAESVRRAVAEYARLGADQFRSTYDFRAAPRLVLKYDGHSCDARAIVGVAHWYDTGDYWRASGARDVVRTLQRLGFDARDLTGLPKPHPRAHYGEVTGYPEGTTFGSRQQAHDAGVHRPLQAGICGTEAFGAESIVVSGGYVDDDDRGELIIYTGHGGQDDNKRQIADQTFDDSGNAALRTSSRTGATVRVIRGAHHGSPYAPSSGFRYDGLFRVVDAWHETGKDGFQICRFKLIKHDADVAARTDDANDGPAPAGNKSPGRRESIVQRVVRCTEVSQYIKQLYDDTCQACGTRLPLPGGRGYSEGAHIRPLGRGHDGPDVSSNVLCLCPNCHVLFDKGALVVDTDMKVWVNGEPTRMLVVDDRHVIDDEHLVYHRDRYGWDH